MKSSVALITGASQGIGQAAAVRLARDFSGLALVARNRANLEETAALVRSAGAEALVVDADLGQVPSAQLVVEQTLSTFGRIDALLNTAGAVPRSAHYVRRHRVVYRAQRKCDDRVITSIGDEPGKRFRGICGHGIREPTSRR